MSLCYRTRVKMTDDGPYVWKIIIDFPVEVTEEEASADKFNVFCARRYGLGEDVIRLKKENGDILSQGYAKIKKAYPSDINGNRVTKGNYVTLEMWIGAKNPMTNPMAAAHGTMKTLIFLDYRITLIGEVAGESGLVFDKFTGSDMRFLKGWKHGVSSFDQMPLQYGFWEPDRAYNEKLPLIIWLHGAGEGGKDPMAAYAGNNVISLSTQKIQKYFEMGACILVPQAPTRWLDPGDEPPAGMTFIGNENLAKAQLTAERNNSGKDSMDKIMWYITKKGYSIYTEGLKALIDEFIEDRPYIDRDRVYLGGCSNGGFMTMRMMLSYPEIFAAYFPVCEAYYDAILTDEDINKIKDYNIWFVHTANDRAAIPEMCILPTMRRLKEAGADNVHCHYFDRILDDTGDFDDEEGNIFEYNPHYSWVYALKNHVWLDFDGKPVTIDGREVTLFDWLSQQRRKR